MVFAAVVFAVVHLAQPGVSWLQLACITGTGTLYGWIRCRSGSAAPAAVSHAVYNLALYVISGAMLLGEKALSSALAMNSVLSTDVDSIFVDILDCF
jgi:membrane protease YdiL (CAAX protease family)